MGDFDYGKAEADLDGVGCPDPEDVYDYKSEKGFNSFMRENGLNPDNYRTGSGAGLGYGSSGTEGCYITTACVAARGLGDDCEELRTLRYFRDTFLKNRKDGLKEIDRYYASAPQIVSAINSFPDAKVVWKKIYEEMICPCVDLIKQGQFEETYRLYKGYVEVLSAKYHV